MRNSSNFNLFSIVWWLTFHDIYYLILHVFPLYSPTTFGPGGSEICSLHQSFYYNIIVLRSPKRRIIYFKTQKNFDLLSLFERKKLTTKQPTTPTQPYFQQQKYRQRNSSIQTSDNQAIPYT